MNIFRIVAFVVFLLPVFFLKAQNYDAKVDSLLNLMTLEEKIGQMNLYNSDDKLTGPALKTGESLKYDHLKKGWVGGFLNALGVKNIRKLQEIAVKETRLGIPLIFGFDLIHGYKTISPVPLAEAASWDLELIEKSARMGAIEATAVGINWTFAPMVDISRDPRWGRIMEGAGEDPYLGSRIAEARVRGFQGKDLSKNNTLLACLKHLAGYGFSESGKDYNTTNFSRNTLHNTILPPFKAGIKAGAGSVMNGFNEWNGIPVTASHYLQRDILKNKWGFEGFIVSDWSSIKELIYHGYAKDEKQAAELSIKAGSDMDMESYIYVPKLKELVENNKVDIKLIDDAVRRILKTKFELGLFDNPYLYLDEDREKNLLNHPNHHAIALDMALSSIVLLKNKDNILPLKKENLNIAIIGQLADEKDSPLGNWRLSADYGSSISLVEALKKGYPKNEVAYVMGSKVFEEKGQFAFEIKIDANDLSQIKEAQKIAKSADVVIMVLGEHGYQSGESRSRANLDLPGRQQELLEKIYAVNPNIVLVLMNGRPLIIDWADKNIPAIVEAWHLGSQSGNAIAKVIFGDYNPSGKLPMTFPKSLGQIPIYYNHNSTGRGAKLPNNLVFWSHYMDESNDPLYPFGYGLSYTKFKYSELELENKGNFNVLVSFTLTNIGNKAGAEVSQLYIRDNFASTTRPIKELKGFKKIFLEVGQTQKVEFLLTKKELGFYDNEGEFRFEEGDFEVMIGGNSKDLIVKKIKL